MNRSNTSCEFKNEIASCKKNYESEHLKCKLGIDSYELGK